MLRRLLVLLMLLALGLPAVALEFAALTVTPHGRQSYDIATGITVLPDGGTLTDREGKATISGSLIRYRQDDFVEVEDASLEGSFGTLGASALYLDLGTSTLQARGPITFFGEELAFSSGSLTLYLNQGIAVASAGVTGSAPAFEAEALLADLTAGEVLLVGPYRYEHRSLVLQSLEADDLLYLQLELGANLNVEASTTVPEGLLSRFGPFLHALSTADATTR